MPGFQHEGSVDANALIVGHWAEIYATPLVGAALFVGSAQNGVLTIEREIIEHKDTSFPRRTDMRIPVSVGMRFTADLDEVHAENMALVLGKDWTSAIVNDEYNQNYLYFGALDSPMYFGLHGTRRRPADKQWAEFHIHKASAHGEVTVGGGDDFVGIPFEAVAHDDEAGTYGGSTAAPLGWINFPIKT